jgi:hypothetical protein
MVNDFVSDMNSAGTRSNYSFVHFHNPDTAGHASGWGGTAYNNAVALVDDYLGQIFSLVETNAALKGKTAIILTSDHGGTGTNHATATDALDYVIPFLVWGPTVTPGTDLYLINPAARQNPGTRHVVLSASGQPIYNGEAANLGLSLLGMNSIAGSTHNLNQSLKVSGLRQVAIAGCGFSEAALGADDYVVNGTSKEIGFTTSYTIPSGATSNQVGTRSSGSSLYTPVLTHRSASATTTFDQVDLEGYYNVRVSLDIRVDATSYEAGDFVKVTVTNGVQTLTVVDLQGSSGTDPLDLMMNGGNSGYYNFSLLLPDTWQQATLVIQSFSNSSSSGAERYDFDNILFTAAVPEPAGPAMGALCMIALLSRRNRRG